MRRARVSQDKSTLNGAKDVTLLCTTISGELTARGQSGDRVGLMLPLSPGRRLREMSAQSSANVRPLSIAKHVDKIQVSRHQRLNRAIEHERFDRAAPMTQGFACPWQVDTPLMHVQGLGAKVHLRQIHQTLGVGRAKELTHLDGTRLAVLLALPAEPCPSEPSGGRGQGASGDLAEQRGKRSMYLVGMNPARDIEQICNVLW